MIDPVKALAAARAVEWRAASGQELAGQDLERYRVYVGVVAQAMARFDLKQAEAEQYAAIEAFGEWGVSDGKNA
ncbi:MAG TPA: hypothetical protein VKB47_08635 [Terracidiphilus sp.]|nr:hypothetical protein [Terracidiphilus sp.]